MSIVLLGLNHKTAPLYVRENLSALCRSGHHPLNDIKKINGVEESFFLSTCNRTEILFRADRDAEKVILRIKGFLQQKGSLSADEIDRYTYVLVNEQAAGHLFRVAASLDSMIVGEPQILGQMKEAYRDAVRLRGTGVMVNKLVHCAFHAAKRVRTETGIASHAVSVSYAAVELAKKIFGSLARKSVLLVGAGDTAGLAARHLMANGAARIVIANRTFENALSLAEKLNGEAARLEDLPEYLMDADIVITSTGASKYIISRQMAESALSRRKSSFLFLMDIAVPRNIDPAVASLDNVHLYNIDDLQDIVDENRVMRQREAERAEAVIAEELRGYVEWFNALDVIPVIVSLKGKADDIIRHEWEKSSRLLQTLQDEERRRVKALLESVVNKILHDPFVRLKEKAAVQDAKPYASAIRDLFNLQEESSENP